MIVSLVVYAIPFVLGVVLIAAALNVYFHFSRARSAPYFRIRQAAARSGWQWVLIGFASAVSIAAALFARRYVEPFSWRGLFSRPDAALPTLAPDLAPSRTPPGDDRPLPPTITPTQPSATPPPTPLIATIEAGVEVSPDARLTITAISTGITPERTPVNTGTEFPAGTQRLYFWFEFVNLANGISWSQVLLRNGSVVRSESEAWSQGTEGIGFYYFEAQGGWPGGEYEIQFYLGDQLAATASFAIID